MKNFIENITLSNEQKNVFDRLEMFIKSEDNVFILKGYAGTGKTTILKKIIDSLIHQGVSTCLMAPTGRAAKILSDKTNKQATTIHKEIYVLDDTNPVDLQENEFQLSFKTRSVSFDSNTVFIIDEASMISDKENKSEFLEFGTGKLLSDLLIYCKIRNANYKNKIIFVGDPAQLPPIGMTYSPALSHDYLKNNFNIISKEFELKEIHRQVSGNTILKNSQNIREDIENSRFNQFSLSSGKNLTIIEKFDFLKRYNTTNSDKIVITFKNATAKKINSDIRNTLYDNYQSIRSNDKIIITTNNYLHELMNGQFARVVSVDTDDEIIKREVRLKGRNPIILKWRKLKIEVENRLSHINCLMLDNIIFDEELFTSDLYLALYLDFKNRYSNLNSKSEDFKELLRKDPFLNALQFKFGYAVTCHKAQGGEWKNVFVFWDKTPNSNQDFFRWSYTALTRASEQLVSVGNPKIKIINHDAMNEIISSFGNEKSVIINQLIDIKLANLISKDVNIKLQNHLIQIINYLELNNSNIQVVKWEHNAYEINIKFVKAEEYTVLKFWHNNHFKINKRIMPIPRLTNSKDLTEQLLAELPLIEDKNIIRKNLNIIKYSFNKHTDNSLLWLNDFFLKFESRMNALNISIKNIDHKPYRERYSIARGKENATFDIVYKRNGKISQITNVVKQTDSLNLLRKGVDEINNLYN